MPTVKDGRSPVEDADSSSGRGDPDGGTRTDHCTSSPGGQDHSRRSKGGTSWGNGTGRFAIEIERIANLILVISGQSW